MIQIGQHNVHVPPPGAMRSFALQQRIIPVASRIVALFAVLAKIDLKKGWEDIDLEEVVRVLPEAVPHLGSVFSDMPKGELEWITRELLRDATAGKTQLFGGPAGDAFDGLMAGRTIDTWKLLWHALGVWYPDFFGGVRALHAKRAAQKASHDGSSGTSDTSGQPGPADAS
jgi:hypothetical protein